MKVINENYINRTSSFFPRNVTSPQHLKSNDVVFIYKQCADNQSDVILRWYIGVITHGTFPCLYIENKLRAVVEFHLPLNDVTA